MSIEVEQPQLGFPNRVSRILLLAMQEVMGVNGINAVLNTARLSYLIDKIKHHSIYAHIRLEKGERSELANLANELL